MKDVKEDRTHLRGFGSMDKVKVRQLASLGGKKAHELGVAHEWTSAEASEAGRIGGRARTKKASQAA